MAIPDLPQEILIDIFSRLPTKSVGKCRCLSKLWRSQLSTLQFTKAHLLKTRKTHQQNLILIDPSHYLYTVAAITNNTVSTELELPGDWYAVVGSCDGLVSLINTEDEIFLSNPITLELVKVPALPKQERFCFYKLGYDSFADDYKIVALSCDNEQEPYCSNALVDVYSVKSGLWKRVDRSPSIRAVFEHACGAFINGAIHWLASNRESGYRYTIVAFNLADEVFDEFPTPKEIDLEEFLFNNLVVLRGCLCMMVSRGADRPTDLWIMKEYGVVESWIKFSIYHSDDEWDLVIPLCLIRDDDEEIVLLNEGDMLVVSNLKEGNLKDMVVDGVEAEFIDGCTFVESLISPAFKEENVNVV